MKIKYIFFLFMLLICRSTWGQSQPFKDEIPKDFKLEMKRLGCFFDCPVYSLVVTADGTVTYDGVRFVIIKGKKVWKADKNSLRKLIAAIRQADFFSIPDHAGCPMTTDVTVVKISVNMRPNAHEIYYVYGCIDRSKTNNNKQFKAIEKLSAQIDKLCGTIAFVGTREEYRKNNVIKF